MDQAVHFDAVLIGSGQGAGPLATALAGAGHKTALVERIHVGGTCINEGCTPTKTMVASARVAYLAARSRDYGVLTGAETVDMRAVLRRKQAIVDSFREGSTHHIEDGGVDLIMGEACFTGPHSLDIHRQDGTVQQVTADLIVIDTGARPGTLPIPGLDSVPALNSTTIMDLEEAPEHLVVLGGGYIGLEFGQMFRRFGSRVTILQNLPKLMGHEDDDIADAVAAILREDGIEILLEVHTERVERGDDGTIRLLVRTPDGEREVAGTHLLVAAGRAPNTEALHLEAAGIGRDQHGFIQVNDRLETGVPGVYALGDVAGSPQFTHIAYDDFRILRENLLRGGNRNRRDRLIPYTMFTDPQLGRVGLTETEARRQGLDVVAVSMPMNYVARAIEVDETRGLMKAVVEVATGQILGAAVLGLEGGEIMAMLEIAMMGKLPYTALRDGIFAHPTLAESMNTLFDQVDSKVRERTAPAGQRS